MTRKASLLAALAATLEVVPEIHRTISERLLDSELYWPATQERR